jgi:thymidylate synthase ThyX
MKKYVVEVVEKITYKVECEAMSEEHAENFVRHLFDSGHLEGTGELESVTFEVEEKEDK